MIMNIIQKSINTIINKTTQSLQSLKNNIQSYKLEQDVQQHPQSHDQNIIQQPKQIEKSIHNQKVLQIDVIQSNYIPKSNQVIQDFPQINIVTDQHPQPQRKDHNSQYQQMLSQKKAILQQLKKIDNQIAIIKGQDIDDSNLKRKQKLLQQQKARQQAKALVKQLKKQKKQLQQKKKKQNQKNLLLLQQQQEQLRKRRIQQQTRVRQQKRRLIQQRMLQQKRKRQERKLIQKQSNKLLKQLKKQDQILKRKQNLPNQLVQLQQKKKIIQKKVDVNFRDIEQHQKRYIIMKEQQKYNRKQRAESISHAVPKYQRNLWIQKIQQQDFKKKQQQKLKQLQRKAQLQKRLKYGQLVKNIFLPKKKQEIRSFQEQNNKPTTPDTVMLPKISQSQKRITESKAMKKFTQNNRPFNTAYQRPPKAPKEPFVQLKLQENNQQKQLAEQQRKRKQQQMRKQTKDRLKKMQNQSLDILPKSKPKYQNYLGQVKLKPKGDNHQWKKIIQDGKLSKQQKYSQMLKKASEMQKKAKIKQQLRKDGDQQAVNLYIGSIQAKLALLQKF